MSVLKENLILYAVTGSIIGIGCFVHMNWYLFGCHNIHLPKQITSPGCYEVVADANIFDPVVGGLHIRADDVEVDLKGHSITGRGAASLQSGIYIEGGRGVRIRNGTVTGFRFGVRGEPDRDGGLLESVEMENMVIRETQLMGIKITAEEASIGASRIEDLQPFAPRDDDGVQYGIVVDAGICAVRDNVFQGEGLAEAGKARVMSVSPGCAKSGNTLQ